MQDDDLYPDAAMAAPTSLWSTPDRSRWFLIASSITLPAGGMSIQTLTGESAFVDPACLGPFELTECQARRWANDQLGQTLDELKHGIDERLAEVRRGIDVRKHTPLNDQTTLTSEVAPALLELLKKLPGLIASSLARDPMRVETAKTTMADLQRRLRAAGVDLDDRFTSFPDRLAELRNDVEVRRTAAKRPTDPT